jgi:Flp pilus assembly CpaE family ATPase
MAEELDLLLAEVTSSLLIRKISFQEDESRLTAVVKSFAPAIVFIDLSDPDRAQKAGLVCHTKGTATHLVGIASDTTREGLLAAVRSGMRDVLSCPLSLGDVHRCLGQAFTMVEEKQAGAQHRQQVFSFLPAKVGSGASTVALHTACTMARFGSARVALMDLDFDCGVLDFMLNLPHDCGLSQIADVGARMDETLWSRVVAKYGELDVLRAGSSRANRRVSSKEMDHILGFARANYDVMCVDLPGASSELYESVLEQSDQVFIVCTPEVSSVHLVRRRLELLREMKLADRARVIYNRCEPGSPLNRVDVEDVLGTKVYAMIDNDYASLQKAVMNGRPVDVDTQLGRAYTQLVNKIIGVETPAPVAVANSSSRIWNKVKRFFQPPTPANSVAGLLQ